MPRPTNNFQLPAGIPDTLVVPRSLQHAAWLRIYYQASFFRPDSRSNGLLRIRHQEWTVIPRAMLESDWAVLESVCPLGELGRRPKYKPDNIIEALPLPG